MRWLKPVDLFSRPILTQSEGFAQHPIAACSIKRLFISLYLLQLPVRKYRRHFRFCGKQISRACRNSNLRVLQLQVFHIHFLFKLLACQYYSTLCFGRKLAPQPKNNTTNRWLLSGFLFVSHTWMPSVSFRLKILYFFRFTINHRQSLCRLPVASPAKSDVTVYFRDQLPLGWQLKIFIYFSQFED